MDNRKGAFIMSWIWERLKEETTWAGIVSVLTSLGVVLSPSQAEAIIALGLAVVGAILAFRKDKGV